MKGAKWMIMLGAFIGLLTACEEEIKFKEPIPSHARNKSQFDSGVRGLYFSNDDSTYLEITKNSVAKKWEVNTMVGKVEADSLPDFKWQNGKLIANDASLSYSYKVVGDTIEIKATPQYIEFELDGNNVLRKQGNLYFLNQKRHDNLWEVQVLIKENRNEVRLKTLYATPDNIALIDSLITTHKTTNDAGETQEVVAQPSKSELKALLETEMLSGGMEFTRVKK